LVLAGPNMDLPALTFELAGSTFSSARIADETISLYSFSRPGASEYTFKHMRRDHAQPQDIP
jgi:hypothetical protein